MALGVSVGVGVNNARLRTGLADAQKRVGTFADSTQKRIGAGFTKGFSVASIAGGAFALALGRIAEKFDAIDEAAKKANTDPEEFQRQAHAFKKAGVEMEGYTKALGRMARAAEEANTGNKAVAESFAVLGVNVEEFKALTPDKAILVLADAYDQATDKGAALNAMSAILGKSAQDLIPAFEGGAEAIKEAGDKLKNVATQEDLDRVAKFNDIWDDIVANFQNLVIKAAELPDLFNRAGQGYEHFFNVIKKGKKEADRILFQELADLNLTEHGKESSLIDFLPESERKRLLEKRHGKPEDTRSLAERANEGNAFAAFSARTSDTDFLPFDQLPTFARETAMGAISGAGSATGERASMNSDPAMNSLRQIALDISRIADIGVVVKPGMAEY